jgi:phospholipase/carboxylesterase
LFNVRVQSDTELSTFEDWTLRVRRAASEPSRLLLLLHGWTGGENSMWIFVRNFPSDYWMLAPRAPHAAQPEGFSWRPFKPGTRETASMDDLRPATQALIKLVDAYRVQEDLAEEPFDVIGFSQGAALTNALALLYPQRVRRIGVLAGFVPKGAEDLVAGRVLAGKPFFVAHGTLDEMVKVEYARQSVHLLEQAGAQVTFCEDEVGHRLSASCLQALEAFFG